MAVSFNKARALQEAEKSLGQGRISQAIQQYLEIIENDPSDLALINLAGDLCARDNGVPQALKLFGTLAGTYVREGFFLRAIAIYKKILKLEPEGLDTILKLAGLYVAQGLTREGRELYAQALAIAERQNLKEKAIEVMRAIVASEPANVAHLRRLGESCLAAGHSGEALRVYLEAAEAALNQGDRNAAAEAVRQAAAIQPENTRVQDLRRRLDHKSEAADVTLPQALATPSEGEDWPGAVNRPEAADPGTAAETKRESGAVEDVKSESSAAGEIDLSTEWEAVAAAQSAVTTVSFNFEESAAEVEFYFEHGMAEEARRSLEVLSQQFPGNQQVAELQRRFEVQARAASGTPAPDTARNLMDNLAHDLEQGWQAPEETAAKPAPRGKERRGERDAGSPSPLGTLVDELRPEGAGVADEDDPQTHYDLGVAFREMGLIDEAIGEFQKAVRRARPGAYPPQFLSACSLLALSFIDKRMPALAAKWYARLLEMPGLDPEAAMALHYDLAAAFEQAGDLDAARTRFLEVYSQNIDYRDVAEKVRLLAAKP